MKRAFICAVCQSLGVLFIGKKTHVVFLEARLVLGVPLGGLGELSPEGGMRQCVFLLQAVLAGIILSNVVPYLEAIYNLPALWRQDQYECVSTDVSVWPEAGWRAESRSSQS